MPPRKQMFINRELSWLEFNQRVLDEAGSEGVPCLDRLFFLSITASNLDEFFMVRVGGLKLMIDADVKDRDRCGMTPGQQVAAIRERVERMVKDQYACYLQGLGPTLAEHGIRRLEPREMTNEQGQYLERFYEEEVAPIVTPMAVSSDSEFPLLRNLGLNVAVRLAPERKGEAQRFAVIPLGSGINRFVTLPGENGYSYVLIEDVVHMFVDRLFAGERVMETAAFRITRNADLSAREDFAADFLAEMQDVLNRRRQSGSVRLEIDGRVTRMLLKFLQRKLEVADQETYEVEGPVDLGAFSSLAFMEGFEHLRYPAWPPQPSPDVDPKRSMFQELTEKSLLLVHPFESFDPVVRFVQEAARDPDVLAIKQILYRTSAASPIVEALREAAERGKYVTALVELRARFDEARNIEWAQELENAGVQVIYGVKGLKVHAKVCIVVRREAHGVVRYCHFGTGNYNERTARLYTDISYMTKGEEYGADASAFFNAVSGYSEPRNFSKLSVSPLTLKDHVLELIENEAERCKQGQEALIMAKMNSLVDTDVIRALYKASRAGVRIKLNVRGICCLRPGKKGLSETISVVSIVDRFLEHSRIFYFHQGGDEQIYIASADWMPRNLERRVELLVPVDEKNHRRRLMEILDSAFSDNVKAHELSSDGHYRRRKPRRGSRGRRSQEELYHKACAAIDAMRKVKPTAFEPHRPIDEEI